MQTMRLKDHLSLSFDITGTGYQEILAIFQSPDETFTFLRQLGLVENWSKPWGRIEVGGFP